MMGQVFQRKYKAADGTLKKCKTWTIRWYRGGRAHEESTKFTRKGDALNQLKLRNGDLAKGKPITAAQFKLTFDDAVQTVLNDGWPTLAAISCSPTWPTVNSKASSTRRASGLAT